MNYRTLGTVAMIGSPMLLIESLATGFQQHDMTQLFAAMSLVYIVGWICGVIGLYRLRATGAGRAGRGILIVQLVGLALAAAWTTLFLPAANPDQASLVYQVTDVAWPLSHIFMVVVGVAAIRAGVLRGWQRFAPLIAGLALPGTIAISIVAGDLAGGVFFAVCTFVGFALQGYAVFSAEPATAPAYPVAAN